MPGPGSCITSQLDRPISVYRLGEMPIQSCEQSVSTPHGEGRAIGNALERLHGDPRFVLLAVEAQVEFESEI
jgi:hypothetical protein